MTGDTTQQQHRVVGAISARAYRRCALRIVPELVHVTSRDRELQLLALIMIERITEGGVKHAQHHVTAIHKREGLLPQTIRNCLRASAVTSAEKLSVERVELHRGVHCFRIDGGEGTQFRVNTRIIMGQTTKGPGQATWCAWPVAPLAEGAQVSGDDPAYQFWVTPITTHIGLFARRLILWHNNNNTMSGKEEEPIHYDATIYPLCDQSPDTSSWLIGRIWRGEREFGVYRVAHGAV